MNFKRVIFILYLFFIILIIHASDKIFHFIDTFHKKYPVINSICASFTQVKHSPIFLEDITAHGTFYLRRTKNEKIVLKWEYAPPYEGWTLIKNEKYYVFTKSLNQLEIYNASKYLDLKTLFELFDFNKNAVQNFIKKGYIFKVKENANEKIVTLLAPKSKQFKKLEVYFDKKTLLPLRIFYYKKDDEWVKFFIENIELNKKLKKDVFNLKVNKDTVIIEEKDIKGLKIK